MRTTIVLICTLAVSSVALAQPCEVMMGSVLAPESLRPKMIVEEQALPIILAPGEAATLAAMPLTLDANDIGDSLDLKTALSDAFGMDDYLAAEGVVGPQLVLDVKFTADATLDVTLTPLANLVDTPLGDFTINDPSRVKTLTYTFDLRNGTGERPRFKLLGTAEGAGEYYRNISLEN